MKYSNRNRAIDLSSPPLFLTVMEAAELAGVSDQHIRKLLIDGTIKGCKIGSVWRINTQYFLEYLGLK